MVMKTFAQQSRTDAKIIDLVQRITPTGYTQAMSFLTGKKRRK